MEPGLQRNHRTRTNGHVDGGGTARRALHGNRRWVADGVTGRSGTSTPHVGSDGGRWERGGHRGGARGRGHGGPGKIENTSDEVEEVEEVDLDDPEEREKFWQQVCH